MQVNKEVRVLIHTTLQCYFTTWNLHQQFKREFKSVSWLYLIGSAGKFLLKAALGTKLLKKTYEQNEDTRKSEYVY